MTSTTENPINNIGKTSKNIGQMEVVLPRPPNPSRNLMNFHKTVNTRSSYKPSVYDTIKQLLQLQERLQVSVFLN